MRSRHVTGITLFELILVIAIAGLLLVVSMPEFPGFAVELRTQAEQLAGDIRYTQSISMHRGARFRINFFSTYYTITDLAGTASIPNPSNNAAQKNMESGIILSLNASIPNSFLVFDGRGAPYVDTGSTGLSSTGTITLAHDTETQLVQVSPETGAVVMGGGT